MVRTETQPIKPARAEKVIVAHLTANVKHSSNRSIRQPGDVIRIVRLKSVIRWHRELLRRNWTQEQKNKDGRPRIHDQQFQIIQTAIEHFAYHGS